jgi:hypothetical protein
MSPDAVECTVKSLQWIYAVVIALSISEAFKQFVPDPQVGEDKRGIRWGQLPLLCSLLVLVVPFFHGMTRFLSAMYSQGNMHAHYDRWLLLDCSVFTVEAGVFFILARSLSKDLWRRFGLAVMALLLLDIEWGALVWKYRTDSISSWVVVNLWSVPLLAGILLALRRRSPWWGTSFTAAVVLARTVADYWTGWPFYFPQ